MPAPPSRRGLPGIWLTRGGVEPVTRWAARGVLPLHVIPLSGWTAILPAGKSLAAAPYDECLPVLAARPMPHRLRPALGFFVIEGRAVVSVRPGGLRSAARFVVWESGSGLLRSPGLPVATPVDLVRSAGAAAGRGGRGRPVAELRDLLRAPGGAPQELLRRAMGVLDLPGRGLLLGRDRVGESDGAVLVRPDRRNVRRFDQTAHEEHTLRTELGLDR